MTSPLALGLLLERRLALDRTGMSCALRGIEPAGVEELLALPVVLSWLGLSTINTMGSESVLETVHAGLPSVAGAADSAMRLLDAGFAIMAFESG